MRGLRLGFGLLILGAACASMQTAEITPEDLLYFDAARPATADDGTVDETAASEPAPLAVEDVAAAEPEEPWLAIREVRVEPSDGGRLLVIALTRTPEGIRDFMLDDPPRLVVDVAGPPAADVPALARFPIEDDVVTRVRVAPRGHAMRVVLDLREGQSAPQVRQEGTRLVALLDGARPEPTAATGPLGAEPPAPEPRAALEAPPDGLLMTAAAEAVEPEAEGDDGEAPVMAAAAEPPPPPPAPLSDAEPLLPTPAPLPAAPTGALALSRGPSGPRYTGQRISLDFKDADLQNVLRVLADVSGLNMIATDDVKGKVTLHLSDVPWDQALDLVLDSNRLEKTREGNVVRISTVTRLREEREALRLAREAAKELEPLQVQYVRVNYARADEALVDKVKGVLTDRGSVTFDDRTNTIIIRDIQIGIDDARQLIGQLDTQSPQVLIEANIVEATEDFARALGIQWGYAYRAGPLTGNPTGQNFPGTVGVGGGSPGTVDAPPIAPGAANPGVNPGRVPFLADFPVPGGFGSGFGGGTASSLDMALGSLDGSQTLVARLTALEEEGKGRIISRPRVITMNNVAATIQSLTILRVKLPSTGTVINTGTGGVAGTASAATEKINTGITLVVTPQVSDDGYVLMSIFAKSSTPDFTRAVDGIPNEISREANSNVLIRDGETVVLGGIYRKNTDDREAGVPYLRRVPGLGWLFRRTLTNDRRDELLVFLTPRILSASGLQLPSAARLWEARPSGS